MLVHRSGVIQAPTAEIRVTVETDPEHELIAARVSGVHTDTLA
jgi:hypothetical protein